MLRVREADQVRIAQRFIAGFGGYSHYFRAQVDLTEISFNVNDYEYQVTDDYNGEEKPAQTIQGVSVTTPGKPKEVTFICRAKPKADYTDLQAVVGNGK